MELQPKTENKKCPKCLKDSLVIEKGRIYCKECGFEEKIPVMEGEMK